MDWQTQSNSNLLAFLSNSEFSSRKRVLSLIANAFEERHVLWELTCSGTLFFKGIVDNFHDFDIVINHESLKDAISVLESVGAIDQNVNHKEEFFSEYFGQFDLEGVEIDLFVNFGIKTFGTEYVYMPSGTEKLYLDGNIIVPVSPVEAMLIEYAMMEGWQARRRFKRELCFRYLKEQGIKNKKILEEAKKNFELPLWMFEIIKELEEK